MNLLEAIHELETNPKACYICFDRSQAGFPVKIRLQHGKHPTYGKILTFQSGEPLSIFATEFLTRKNFYIEYLTPKEQGRRSARELTKDEIKHLVTTLLDELARR